MSVLLLASSFPKAPSKQPLLPNLHCSPYANCLTSNVRYETTVPILSSSLGLTHSFMDTLGRTTLTLTAVNVVDEIRDREIIVTYEYPWIETLRKPGMIAGSVFGVFAVAWAIGRIPTGIGKVKKV